MIWGYLTEFWNAITGVGEYAIEWFQGVGNAVAGAIGGLFHFINHSITDIFVLFGWLFSNFRDFFIGILLPIRYVYTFLKEFINTAVISPTTSAEALWQFPGNVMDFFNAIPLWNILSSVLGIAIIILVGFAILKRFSHI